VIVNSDKHSSWKRALVLTLLLRIAYSTFAALAALIEPVSTRLMYSNALTQSLPQPSHSLRYLMLGVWERFDTLWYLRIAARGYDRPEAVVFFPLYPGLIRVFSFALSPLMAALVISTTAAFLAFWGLHEFLRRDCEDHLASHAVILCAVWPASFIFFAGYADSLLLAFIVWSLCMARDDRWWAAVVLGIAAVLTKALGVVVFIPLLIIALRRHKAAMVFPSLLIPLSAAAYQEYIRWTTHMSLNAVYQRYWRTMTELPWKTIWIAVSTLNHAPNMILALNLGCLIVICLLVAVSRAELDVLLYAAAAIGMILSKQTVPPMQSMMRYVLIIFPAFLGLARVVQKSFFHSRFALICVCLFVLNLGLLWLFVGWSLVV
jgi:hypothetical protein